MAEIAAARDAFAANVRVITEHNERAAKGLETYVVSTSPFSCLHESSNFAILWCSASVCLLCSTLLAHCVNTRMCAWCPPKFSILGNKMRVQ